MRIVFIFFIATIFINANAIEQEQLEAFDQWFSDKSLVTIKKDKGDLSIGGEVRVEYQNDLIEKENTFSQNIHTYPRKQGYDVEINLMLDYKADRMWGSIKLEFDNKMGTQDGEINKLCLEKAYFGGRLAQVENFTLDAEVGRRALCNAFTSKIQFGSRFDGLLLKTNVGLGKIGDWYSKGAIFLISDSKGRFAQAFETGLLNIGDANLDLRYSLINWSNHPFEETNNRFNYLVSQVTLNKTFEPFFIDKTITPYVAGIINTAAHPTVQSNGKEANLAWYAGFSIGKIKRVGDWSFDTNYQWVQAQAIPEYDSSGIGRGNPEKVGFYTQNLDGTGPECSCQNAVGRGNYHGVRAELQYALYDNLTVFNCYQFGRRLDPELGPNLKYQQFEVELIYSF